MKNSMKKMVAAGLRMPPSNSSPGFVSDAARVMMKATRKIFGTIFTVQFITTGDLVISRYTKKCGRLVAERRHRRLAAVLTAPFWSKIEIRIKSGAVGDSFPGAGYAKDAHELDTPFFTVILSPPVRIGSLFGSHHAGSAMANIY
jgi:hypothetical protein